MSLSKNSRRKSFLLAAATIWICCLVFGVFFLTKFAGTPGDDPVNVSKTWPTNSKILKNNERPTFVIFAHPRCSCSSATLGELERLMPFFKGQVDVQILFVQLEGRTPAWVQTSLWDKARSIPGVQVSVDVQAQEVDKFGARTSGQSFLYDKNGALIFSGGITAARGHMGDSKGRDFIISWLRGKESSSFSSHVFGCALKNSESNFDIDHSQENHEHQD